MTPRQEDQALAERLRAENLRRAEESERLAYFLRYAEGVEFVALADMFKVEMRIPFCG